MGFLQSTKTRIQKSYGEINRERTYHKLAQQKIDKEAREATYQERQIQAVRVAKERERIRADATIKRERAYSNAGQSSFGGGMMNIAQNYTKNAQSQSLGSNLFGQPNEQPAKVKSRRVVRYVKIKPKPKVKRRRVVRYVKQKQPVQQQAPQRFNTLGW